MSDLRVSHLQVRYGNLVGVADVSLAVAQGSVVALLGSNGAGKTTTLNAIAGLVPKSRGSIEWDGAEIGGQPAYAVVRGGRRRPRGGGAGSAASRLMSASGAGWRCRRRAGACLSVRPSSRICAWGPPASPRRGA